MKNHLNKIFIITILGQLFAMISYSAAASLDGVWRSESYGWILQIAGNQKTVYHQSPQGCLESGDILDELEEQFTDVELLNETELLIGSEVEDAYYYFQRISELPAECQQSPDDGPVAVLEMAISYMDALYPFMEERGIDWAQRKSYARAQVSSHSSDTDLKNAIASMLDGFGDAHLKLGFEENGGLAVLPYFDSTVTVPLVEASISGGGNRQEKYDDWRGARLVESIYQMIDEGAAGAAGGSVMWYREESIGYLMINDMIGFTDSDSIEGDVEEINEIMDTALTDLEGIEELIVDVSLNGGGSDAVSRTIANRFASRRTFAYSKSVEGNQGAPVQDYYLEPTNRPSFYGPVHLLTSDNTVSAAEVFTLAMRALPNVRHYGMTTHGSLSDILFKPLPNDWVLMLSNEVYKDSDGVSWEGQGIVPEVYLPIFEPTSFSQSHFDRINDLAADIEAADSRLFNLSARSLIGMGQDTLICGLIIEGDGPRDVAIVARGPSLEIEGVVSAVSDTSLRVYDSNILEIAGCDSFSSIPQEEQNYLSELGILPSDERESALLLQGIEPGVYHIHANSEGSEIGVGTVEVFDVTEEDGESSALINLSTRSSVLDDESVLISGFIVTGQTPFDVVVRGRGPSMQTRGIDVPLENPQLLLVDSNTEEIIAENDDFSELSDDLRTALIDTGYAPENDLESILVTTLLPGSYTAILRASPGSENGIGAIDFYRVSE